MTQLKRTLIIWAVLMGLFLLFIVWINRHGDRYVKAIELESKLNRGKELQSLKRLDEAIVQYESAVSADVQAVQPRILLARAYMDAGRYADALSQADRAVESSSRRDRLSALLLLSDAAREMRLWDKAQAALEEALKMSPQCAEAHFDMAKVAKAMHLYARMIQELDAAGKLDARESSQDYQAARERARQEIARYRKQIEEGEKAPDVYYKLGILYKETAAWNDAISAFEKAVTSGLCVADANFWLGVQAEAAGDLDTAIVLYRKAVDASATHVNAQMNLERCLLLKQVAQQPSNALAWYQLGLVYLELRNWADAHRALSKTVEVDPAFADAHFRLGQALEQLGKPAEARSQYAETIKLLPTHVPAVEAIGK